MRVVKSLMLLTSIITISFLSACTSTHHQESTGQFLDSSAITTNVKAKLLADAQIHSLPISVYTYKGNVTLTGEVDSVAEKQKAVRIARGVAGVRSVTDHLNVMH